MFSAVSTGGYRSGPLGLRTWTVAQPSRGRGDDPSPVHMGRYELKSESLKRVSRLRGDGLKRLTLLASRPARVRVRTKLGGVRRHVTEAANSQPR